MGGNITACVRVGMQIVIYTRDKEEGIPNPGIQLLMVEKWVYHTQEPFPIILIDCVTDLGGKASSPRAKYNKTIFTLATRLSTYRLLISLSQMADTIMLVAKSSLF